MADIKKVSKWIIIPCLFILISIAFFLFIPKSCSFTKEPDNFSKESSLLVQENWSDGFFDSIKLIVNSNEFYIDGVLTSFDDSDLRPIINNNHVFLPINLISNLVKGTVRRDGDNKVIIENNDITLEINIGQNTITVNGDAKILPAFSYRLNDRVMVSYTIIEYFGFDEPFWNTELNEIILTKKYQTHRIIVVTNGSKLIETYGAIRVIESSDNTYVLQYSTEEAAIEADRLFKEDPNILFSEPDTILHSEVSANGLSWGVGRVGAESFTGYLLTIPSINEIIVAVLDTGIDSAHPFFKNRISDIRWNFIKNNNNPNDVHSHGSHVSGIIVDSTPPNVKIMP